MVYARDLSAGLLHGAAPPERQRPLAVADSVLFPAGDRHDRPCRAVRAAVRAGRWAPARVSGAAKGEAARHRQPAGAAREPAARGRPFARTHPQILLSGRGDARRFAARFFCAGPCLRDPGPGHLCRAWHPACAEYRAGFLPDPAPHGVPGPGAACFCGRRKICTVPEKSLFFRPIFKTVRNY